MPEVQIKTIEPLAISPKAAASALSITSRAVYLLLADGKLTARKLGSRTLIDYQSVTDFYRSLPAKTIAASIPNAPVRSQGTRRRKASGRRAWS
jgi:excisionase family DNA binding protein